MYGFLCNFAQSALLVLTNTFPKSTLLHQSVYMKVNGMLTCNAQSSCICSNRYTIQLWVLGLSCNKGMWFVIAQFNLFKFNNSCKLLVSKPLIIRAGDCSIRVYLPFITIQE